MKSYIIDCPVGNTLEFSNNLENQNSKHTASHNNTDNNTSSIPKNNLPEESYALFDSIRPTKKRKGTSYTPVIFAHIEVGNKIIPAKVLLDSGTMKGSFLKRTHNNWQNVLMRTWHAILCQ